MQANFSSLQNFFSKSDPYEWESLTQQFGEEIFLIDHNLITSLIKPRPLNGHKGTFGHALIIAGDEQTPGASILCAHAALRTGCGLLTAIIPQIAVAPLLSKLPEAMIVLKDESFFSGSFDYSRYQSIGFGPGAGTSSQTTQLLHTLLSTHQSTLVIDADGLNILSQNKSWYSLLNKNSVLTPHPVEFDRLTRKHKSERDRVRSQIKFARQYGITVLVKGHHTVVISNKGIYFNTTGNNGMATAGSGDVLAGIITSLCAQGYDAGEAALIGVYMHGYAGDIAAGNMSMHSMIATDIIDALSHVFLKYEQQQI